MVSFITSRAHQVRLTALILLLAAHWGCSPKAASVDSAPQMGDRVKVRVIDGPQTRLKAVQASTSTQVMSPVHPGFTHCCGNQEFAMQIECSERLMRCYQRKEGAWTQTFGRLCSNALEPSCYRDGCVNSCE